MRQNRVFLSRIPMAGRPAGRDTAERFLAPSHIGLEFYPKRRPKLHGVHGKINRYLHKIKTDASRPKRGSKTWRRDTYQKGDKKNERKTSFFLFFCREKKEKTKTKRTRDAIKKTITEAVLLFFARLLFFSSFFF